MLIVEGPDGAGKTTLAKFLAEELELEYRRAPSLSSTDGADTAVWEWWREQLRENPKGVVYDRCFFVSELIYQLATHERELIVEAPSMVNGHHDLWLKDTHWVYCSTPWETAQAVISRQRDQLKGVSILDLEKIHWAYPQIFALMFVGYGEDFVFNYDWTTMNQADVLPFAQAATS
jgi:thymidylate kinase